MPYKTTIKLEVLTHTPLVVDTLEGLARDMMHGDASGNWDIVESKELTKYETAEALVAQGSSPDFLLGEDGWKYSLHNGDEVTILEDGHPVHLTIAGCTWLNDDVLDLLATNGDRREVRVDDIT